MKKLKLFVLGIGLVGISSAGLACSGEWYTCGNLESFMIQVAQNCPDSGSMIITDCDAGSFIFEYSIA